MTIAFESADDLTTGRFRIKSRAQAAVTSNSNVTRSRRPRALIEVNGTRHPLMPPGLVIGRGTEADVRINDPGVSRRHIEFLVFNRGADLDIEVGDLGSTNGMLVDGHRIQRTSVHDGSRVKIGATTITVRVTEDESGDESGAESGGSKAAIPGAPMSELTLFLIRLAYLAILWIFVLSALSVIRSDMFGARMPEGARQAAAKRAQRPPKPAKARRGAPTHVLVVDGDNQGERAELAEAPILIGRGPDAAIRLDDDYVSTRHARIAASGDQWFVEDLGSTNGTYIGNARITQPTTLTLGTQVRVGKTVIELRK